MSSLKKLLAHSWLAMSRRWDAFALWWENFYWDLYFAVMDGLPGRYLLPVTETRLRRYVSQVKRHPHIAFIRGAKQFSMLHEELLALLHHLAATSRGGILEIGTYVGGSTVTMAQALAVHHRPPVTSIEPGGRADHDLIPSEDIFGDLERNLARFGLQGYARLLNGPSWDADLQAEVRGLYGARGVTLLMIDADGNVDRDIALYADLLRDGAVVVLDDYESTGAPEKSVLIKKWVDDAVARGQLTSLGVWGWGTWVGLWRCRV